MSDRIAAFEAQLIEFEKMKIQCQNVKDELTKSLNKEEILRNQLKREQEVIKA